MAKNLKLKITLAKLIEVAYSRDEEMTVNIVRKKGNFKLTVNQNGKVKLHGSAGTLAFNGGRALEGLGVKVKTISIFFTQGEGDNIDYIGSCSLVGGAGSISLSGSFNIETLITSCSGLLCKAARLMKGRNRDYETELKRIMGP